MFAKSTPHTSSFGVAAQVINVATSGTRALDLGAAHREHSRR
jgi:hypothetical protein